MAGRLDRLREQVADAGIIPRRPGATGLPTELYYIKVKELDALLADPSLAEEYVRIARLRSKKRRRKRYLKDTAAEVQLGGGGHGARLASLFAAGGRCLGSFSHTERFVSETGFARARHGYVYEVDGRRVAIAESEAQQIWVQSSIPRVDAPYPGDDILAILGAAEDRAYLREGL